MKKAWEVWKYAIGSFSDDKTEPYDNYVAGIRTIIFVSYMVTNAFIISGVLRHWHDVPSELYETQKERLCTTKSNLS
jgi:ATP/ADP translocase